MPVVTGQKSVIGRKKLSVKCYLPPKINVKAMDDIGVVMTPFWDVVTVSLVANIYVVGFFFARLVLQSS